MGMAVNNVFGITKNLKMKNKSTIIKVLLVCIVFMPTIMLSQQSNDLNQKITIMASNVTISELLLKIGEKADIKFAYNPKLINAKKRVNISSEKKTVRSILDELFESKFDYKLRGKYVIIAEKSSKELTSNEETFISGYILDAETKDGLSNVSIYTSAGKSTITDEIGAFKIKLKKDDNANLEIRKINYMDLSYKTKHESDSQVEIELQAIKSIDISLVRDSMLTSELPVTNKGVKTMFPVRSELALNQENIQDTLTKPFSFSFYPGFSTYGNLSGNIIYNFALNFVGYNRGVSGTEIAALSNINKEDIEGVQVAGISNYVGGDVKGVQTGGIFNKIGGDLEGVQVGGVTNVNLGNTVGTQIAGVNNINLDSLTGVQAAGVYNQADTIIGTQAAGVLNIASHTVGVQASGIGNHTNFMEGTQASGVYNIANNVIGGQVAGVFNVAKNVEGYQIGLFNVADSVSGVSIGLLSFVKNGYKRVGVNTDELG